MESLDRLLDHLHFVDGGGVGLAVFLGQPGGDLLREGDVAIEKLVPLIPRDRPQIDGRLSPPGEVAFSIAEDGGV